MDKILWLKDETIFERGWTVYNKGYELFAILILYHKIVSLILIYRLEENE